MRREDAHQPPYSIEELLSAAQVGEDVTDEELTAAQRRIEQEVATSVWCTTLSPDRLPPEPAPNTLRVHVGALHAQAGRDLRILSALVLRGSDASRHLARLATPGRLEPEGMLIFACLLHLADKGEAAQFWWQFSAGAGSTIAALCLYLMHMHRGELRDADHWAIQAADLERLCTARHARGVHLQTCTGRWAQPTWMVTRLLTELSDSNADSVTRLFGTPDCTRPLPHSLTAAVHRLRPDQDDELEILVPDMDLAHRLEGGCVGA